MKQKCQLKKRETEKGNTGHSYQKQDFKYTVYAWGYAFGPFVAITLFKFSCTNLCDNKYDILHLSITFILNHNIQNTNKDRKIGGFQACFLHTSETGSKKNEPEQQKTRDELFLSARFQGFDNQIVLR